MTTKAPTRRRPQAKTPASGTEESGVTDLHNELSRTYEFPDGDVIRVMLPTAMCPMENGIMLWDNRGAAHIIAPGWRYLRIDPINIQLPHREPTDEQVAAYIQRALDAERRGEPL